MKNISNFAYAATAILITIVIPVATSAQNSFPDYGNVTIDGYSIDLRRPNTTGGWARGFNFRTTNGSSRIGGIGMKGAGTTFEWLYIAFGDKPWSSGQGIYVRRSNGYVGIGTISPNEMLTVDGTIEAEEIIVEQNVGADFVFDEGYNLPKLDEVKAYIQQHNHLPGIPSAKEMKQNGVKVGNLQMKLLQKIEELTLYIIELEKRDHIKTRKIQKLEKMVESLLKRK